MIKRLCTLVVLASVGSALVAGCGGSSSNSSSAATSSAAPAPAATTTAASSAGVGGSSVASNPAVQAAVAQCKASINSAATLSADAKAKLDGLCDEAAKGDPASLRKATAQVCQEVVKESLPSSAQQAALAACPKP
ncbi:MAG TPA: hypothetical protein VMU39_24005 [Solirubrobacteraceae bacterium]|nr:hypothetical protein [Solirubrobacteraceae bacterium]